MNEDDQTKFDAANSPVVIGLTGGKVSAGFRSAVFDCANKHGIPVNAFVLEATGSWLKAAGYEFGEVFPGGSPHVHFAHAVTERIWVDSEGIPLVDEEGKLLTDGVDSSRGMV